MAGAVNVRAPILNAEWEYCTDSSVDEISKVARKEKPKVMLFVIPDNPTSQVLTDESFNAMYSLAQEINATMVVDFAYKDMLLTKNAPRYFSKSPDENFVSIHSNSKWCRGLGRRLGWVEATPEVIDGMDTFLSSSSLCPDNLHQMALTSYLNDAIGNNSLNGYLQGVKDAYYHAAKATTDAISANLPYRFMRPEGGLYTVMDVRKEGSLFVERALKEAGVLLVPGWGFGHSMRNCVRISYGPLVNDTDRIKEGIERLAKVV
jgi:aspartate/methionine/tyrosine aminotransferase